MNKFDKNKKAVQIGFASLCVITVAFLLMMPGSSIGGYLVLVCLMAGYFTHIFSRKMKLKSSEWEKKKMSPKKKLRRKLLEKGFGKVIEFPGPNHPQGERDTKEK